MNAFPYPSAARRASCVSSSTAAKLWFSLRGCWVLVFVMSLAAPGWAQENPVGCTGSGLGIALFVDKSDAHVGDTLHYSALLFNAPFPACQASSIAAWIVTPDGMTNYITLIRTTLDPGQSDNYVSIASYVVRAQDVVGGRVTALAANAAKIHQNLQLGDAGAFVTVNTIIVNPCISITATCANGIGESGTISYSGTVSNCGDTDLANVTVTNLVDGVGQLVFGPVTLAVNQSTNFTGSYKPANPCSSSTSQFRAAGTDQLLQPVTVTAVASTTCNLGLAPAIALTHSCPAAPVAQGGLYQYSGFVTNGGNVTLTNVVVVSDQPAVGTVIFTLASLAPGGVAPFSAQFTAPANTCSVTTSLQVTGKSVCGQAVVAYSSLTCPLQGKPALLVTETCPTTAVAPGATLTYGGTVRNTGDIALQQIVVTSAQPAPGTVVFTLARLDPGAIANFTGSFTTPPDACAVTNTLTAQATDICVGTAVSNAVTTVCPLTTSPRITITKTCPQTPPPLGGTLTYTATVQNAGNVTLTGIAVVSDHPAANTVVFTSPSLAPGAATNFSASYPVPANLNGCSITDTLTASGSDKCSAATVTATTTTTCPVAVAPKVQLTATCPTAPVAPGATLTYNGTVSNIGDINLTNVTVTADLPVAGTVVATIAQLAPGASAPFTGSYTAPVNACETTVNLTARGAETCAGVLATTTFVRTCPLTTTPALSVTKTCPATPTAPGQALIFTGVVANKGNITLTNVVVVNNQPAPNTPVFGPITLAPGASANFTGSFLVPTNLNACSLSSTLTATGNNLCDGQQVSATASAACPIKVTPNLLLTATCPAAPTPQGAPVIYTASLQNIGNVTVTNIVVVGNQPANGTPVIRIDLLAPGQTTNFTASYPAPSNCCEVVSTLLATGYDLCGQTNTSDTSTMVCPVKFTPGIKLTKVCDPLPAVEPGQRLHYKGTVSNTGDIPLVNVILRSDVLSSLGTNAPVLGPISLWPGDSMPYEVTTPVVPELCGGDVLTVTAQSICGGPNVTDTVATTCPVKTTPGIAVYNLLPQQPVQRCALVTGTASVANVGNITLTGVTVTCNLPTNGTPVFGPVTLAPGQVTNFTYQFSAPQYCNCCEVPVRLVATGFGFCEGTVSSASTAVVPMLTTPQLSFVLDCPAAGTSIFTGLVRNSGDVTLSNVVVAANLPKPGKVLVGPINLAPGETEFFAGDTGTTDPAVVRTLVVSATGQNICGGASVTGLASCAGSQVLVPSALDIAIDAQGVWLAWKTTVGARYQVQYNESLIDADWRNLGEEVTASTELATARDPVILQSARFYRVLRTQ